MLVPPEPEAMARFGTEFGQRVLLTVDTEEEFDWNGPFRRDGYTLNHVPQLDRFQRFCERLGAHPVYLVDWPVANDPAAVEIIGDAVRRGTAEIGVQLHPWVNPPFEEDISVHNSYAGNLPRELEAAKFMALRDRIEAAFGTRPMVYRAGRYGLGPNTRAMLKEAGIAVDCSVRARFDYTAQSGPDFSRHPVTPYWIDAERSLLELPVTTMYWGMLRQLGIPIQRIQRFVPNFYAAFSKLRLLERIALTPEGVTVDEAIRGIDVAVDSGLPVLVLSFHSPTLAPGFTPYAHDEADVERLYDWFAQIYAHLARRDVRPATLTDILAAAR